MKDESQQVLTGGEYFELRERRRWKIAKADVEFRKEFEAVVTAGDKDKAQAVMRRWVEFIEITFPEY
ncbi:MAG: hypothetical protein PHY18_05615 [Dehalococcoidales bacterium]|nr:hypothetical protein [Dehalococcoidales bacterium]